MYYTTIEQSKKLLELGLNPTTADMYYFLDTTPAGNIYIPSLMFIEKHLKSRMPEYAKGDIPCWSLGALLELIPNYQLQTQDKNVGLLFSHRKELKIIEASTPTEAAYNMVCWLLENGYIKKVE